MKLQMFGDISLIPFLSDSYFQLLNDLTETSKKFPESLAYPAGSIIIAIACLESYINELIYMKPFSKDKIENSKIKKEFEKLGTNILDKLKELKKIAKEPEKINDDLIDDLRLLIALRGRVVHYSVQEEHPNNNEILSKMQKIEKLVFKNKKLPGIISTERLLNSTTAAISKKVVFEIIKSLYKSGYEPPRPRWVTFLDPKRFTKK